MCGQGPYELEIPVAGAKWGEEFELRLHAPHRVEVQAVVLADGTEVGRSGGVYTTQGEVIVRVRPDNAVDVVDSGPGLSAEYAARLFDRGYRGSHAEHTQGGGIGLSSVRRLYALYGWSVRVVPGAEKGVVATLSFAPEKSADAPAIAGG